ncbi:MAG: hypothetical protein QNJ00_10705 [Woeseiaceae bacterium]|nr:hypothetical protein [Woeseiaceae bacterium]
MKTTIALTVLGALLSIGVVLDGETCRSIYCLSNYYLPNLGSVSAGLLVVALLCLGGAAYRLARSMTPIHLLQCDVESIALLEVSEMHDEVLPTWAFGIYADGS